MKRRILITGGFGYVGGRAARFLASEEGCEVLIGTRGSATRAPWLPEVAVVPMDWSSSESLRRACQGVHGIVHLAALNERESMSDPAAALEVNGVNTVRLLEGAKAAGVARFVYMSTAHVYGSPLAGRISEARIPRPATPYASSHKAAEDPVLAAHDARNLIGVVLRMSNGYGAPAHPGANCWSLLVNDLCMQAVSKGRLILKSHGLQQRDFIPMSDVCGAIRHVLGLPRDVLGDGLFNLGSGRSLRVIDIAQAVQSRSASVLGFAPVIERPEPGPGAEPPALVYDSSRLGATGFVLAGNMAQEIDATLRLCREVRETAER